ncbi:hypothetical protein [Dichotomicrobium thermohalophilum]|uniref:Sulfite dehydrogenase (Cytochrome) subunit SorB n=1 Tax=Dichotomicrobium thermohalophilum TaxID=933063 RepID=A0A397Q5Y8_9HYPH|nr:hypothetical protein [Dichotomicrobium thermohalophilum]RIA55225.1 hypothetical protein BXY53_0284 [Dichotomicrobium thermohalophilum]
MGSVLRRAVLALMIGLGGTLPAAAQDDYEALPEGENKDLVYGVCSGCHSVNLVMQQGMTRKKWDSTLEWMYEQQGMPRLDEETESKVLDYLAEHFNVEQKKDGGQPDTPSPFGTVRPLMPPQ